MTLVEMVSEIYGAYGSRFQVDVETILRYISLVQQSAFTKDLAAFEETAVLTISELAPLGPYTFPTSCRALIRIETNDEVNVAATLQHMRRTAMLHATPSENLVWRYYLRPDDLTSNSDNAKVLIPPEWHYPLLVQGASLLCDSANYGDKAPMVVLEPVLAPFWDACSPRQVHADPEISSGAW